MKIVNLTPHAVNVINDKGETITFEPSGCIARVESKVTKIGVLDDFGIYSSNFGEVTFTTELPEADKYIVSMLVMQAATGEFRSKCLQPNTSPDGAIRNEKGHIVAVKGFLA